MTSGIFFVQFSVGPQDVGAGLAVLSNGDVNGGDETYLYRGHIDSYGKQVKASIEVTHYRGPLNSVFGPLRNFTLDLTGTVDEQGFDIHGHIVGRSTPEIRIAGRKVAQLYERGA
ncbi:MULTISPECIES: GrlR family regulatory protein [Comamonas]|jgi:hypothetical protein|uniref:GrlR family regulatory protein n=1 Tax=Comamonas TaxID=283 RepID=UPI00257A8FA7|nr:MULTISPECIES: GrlR family regulatory protein [Comamonas]